MNIKINCATITTVTIWEIMSWHSKIRLIMLIWATAAAARKRRLVAQPLLRCLFPGWGGTGDSETHCWGSRTVPSAHGMLRSHSFSVFWTSDSWCLQRISSGHGLSVRPIRFMCISSFLTSCTCLDWTIMIMSAGGNAWRDILYNSRSLHTIHSFRGCSLYSLYEILSCLVLVYCSRHVKDGFSHLVPEDCMCWVR